MSDFFLFLFLEKSRSVGKLVGYDSIGFGNRPRFKTISYVALFKPSNCDLPQYNMAKGAYLEELSSRLG